MDLVQRKREERESIRVILDTFLHPVTSLCMEYIEMDLKGVNLTRADLEGANLTGANLTGADLSGANLTGAIGL